MPTRDAVYRAINTERAYQDAQRGNAKRHEGQPAMTPGEYILCMEKCLADAREAWYKPNGGEACMEHIRKVSALGVAAMERYSAPLRGKVIPPEQKEEFIERLRESGLITAEPHVNWITRYAGIGQDMKPIPIKEADLIACQYGCDQVIIYARKVGPDGG